MRKTYMLLVFDDDESNQKACKVLGANFDYNNKQKFKPYFEHPISKQSVYCFFNPCHMLKLVRNYLATKGPIIFDSKDYIRWDFIKKLNNKQYAEDLHCACKIKNRHIYFYNEKMKVFLAVQVLSTSVSKALNNLENEIKDDEFKGSSPTAHFCQMFNDIFDVLNAKNRFCKCHKKRGVTKDSLPNLEKKLMNVSSILKS